MDNTETKNSVLQKDMIGYFMVFGAGVLWGTIGFFVKLISNEGASTTLTAFIRLFMGFWIMVPVMMLKGGIKMFRIDKKGLIHCLLLGILSQALFNYCYIASIKDIGVASSSILLYAAPVFVIIMSKMAFNEHISRLKIFALAANILGCFLMVTGGSLSNVKISVLGVFFGLASAFFYSLVTIIGKIASGNTHPFTMVFYSFLFGWLTLGLITSPWSSIGEVSGIKFWVYSLGYGLIPTVGSYLLYMGGLNKDVEISKVPVIASVETVVASLIGVFVFKEELNFINILGIIILLASIFIMNMNKKKAVP